MQTNARHGGFPDADGNRVSIGDYIEVWCSWTGEPKFNGRQVRVVGVLTGHDTAVFKLEDPSDPATHHYMPASSNSFRLATEAPRAGQSGVMRRSDLGLDELEDYDRDAPPRRHQVH